MGLASHLPSLMTYRHVGTYLTIGTAQSPVSAQEPHWLCSGRDTFHHVLKLDTVIHPALGSFLNRSKSMHHRAVMAATECHPYRLERERRVASAHRPHRRLARLNNRALARAAD